MFQSEGTPLQHRAHHMRPRAGVRQPVKHALGVAIPDRRALSGHVRQEDHAVRAWRNLGGFTSKGFESADPSRLGDQFFRGAQFLAEPAQCTATTDRAPLQ